MFAGSATGAETTAILFSVASSCHRHGVDVFAYLHDLLQRLTHAPNPPPDELRAWTAGPLETAARRERLSGLFVRVYVNPSDDPRKGKK